MEKHAVCLVAACAVGFSCALWAEDWPGAGIYTASDPADFVNAQDASIPFVMGEGILDWTGGDATVTRDLSFWAPQYRANAFKVSDANATLTIAGKFTQTNGCFIKTGPCTLALTYPGAHVTVDEGTLVLGAPGATNNITSMTFIGNRTQKYAALDITNGVVVQPNNWFCIARGTGQTSNDARAEVFVRKDARLEIGQLNIGYGNGMSSPFPRASLIVDGGIVTALNEIFTLETGNGEAHVVVTNGGSFVSGNWNAMNAGWQMKNGSGGTSYVDISASSTGSAHYVSLRANTFLNVTGKSLFEADRTMPNGVNYERGNVTFDDSTLSSRLEGIDPLWFYGYGTNRFIVGQHGMTFHAKTGTDAALYAPVDVAGSTARASTPLKKTGPGSLALVLPYQHPLVVEEGDLRLRNLSHNWEQMPSQTPTLAAGSHLIAAGEGALGRLTVPAGTPLVLRAQGLETSQHSCWYCMGWAAVRPDGFLSLTDGRATSYGSAHLKNKVDVSKSFTLSFDVVPRAFFRNAGTLYGGFMVALNSANYNLIGAHGRDYLGYRYGTFTNAANKSVAMGLDATNRRLTTGTNGAFGATTADLGVSVLTLLTSLDAPHHCTLAYDPHARRLRAVDCAERQPPDGARRDDGLPRLHGRVAHRLAGRLPHLQRGVRRPGDAGRDARGRAGDGLRRRAALRRAGRLARLARVRDGQAHLLRRRGARRLAGRDRRQGRSVVRRTAGRDERLDARGRRALARGRVACHGRIPRPRPTGRATRGTASPCPWRRTG